ncbi:MAG: phosphoribosylaminoimidazolesuccinocarboxamide synthase [Oligoflexales bacterium]
MENPKKLIELKSLLTKARENGNPRVFLESYIFRGLQEPYLSKLKERGFECYRGKVRECLSKKDCIYLIHTDKLSAFDRFITHVPFKGILLAAISRYWYQSIGDVINHAFLNSHHPRVLEMKKLRPVKVEVIVRAYLAGSMLRSYQAGARSFCGQKLPDGLRAFDQLPTPIVTPTTKADTFEHDENLSPSELIHAGLVASEAVWREIEEKALELFRLGSQRYAQCGWILVDTKYEFGTDIEGHTCLIDEVHTPDSSRLWKLDSYRERMEQSLSPEMFDKEIVRRYLLEHGFTGEGAIPPVPYSLIINLLESYLSIYESLVGENLVFKEIGLEEAICFT